MRYQWKIEEASSQDEDDETHYWWLNANPKIWSFANIGIGEAQSYTLYNENGKCAQKGRDSKRVETPSGKV